MGNKNVGLVSNIGLQSMLRNHEVINNTWSINGEFNWDVFPVVHRVAARLLENDLVEVQPMAEPLGVMFFVNNATVDGYKRLSIPLNGLNVLSQLSWIRSAYVQGGERRIRAQWTPEIAQDLEAFHNIDAERELVALLSEEIANQVNRDVINNLQNLRN